MENGDLIKVINIAVCSPFDLHKAIIGIGNQFGCSFCVAA